MGAARSLTVEKILGSKMSADGRSTLVGLTADGGEYHLALSPELLLDLLLASLKARTNFDQIKTSDTDQFTVLPCNKWEIRKIDKGEFMVFGFRLVSGAWVRLKVSQRSATPIRETLEAIEGRPVLSRTRGSTN